MMYKQQSMCCPDTTKLQHDYYVNQAGRGLPHFTGGEYQRGHGLGATISGFLRSTLPLLQPHLAKTVNILKRKALTAGLGVASDVLSGKKLKTSIKERAMQTIGIKKTSSRKKPIKRRAPRKSVSSPPVKRQATSHRYKNTVFH